MKINNTNKNIYTNSTPSFKRYFDANMRKNFERMVDYYKRINPYLKDEDIMVMQNSIDSFNAVYKGAQTINTTNVENQIYNKFHIPTDFKGNKFLASMTALTLNIFQKLRLPLPTGIKVAPQKGNIAGSCSTYTREITFNANEDWSDVQYCMIYQKLENWSSSGHFLSTPVHEFMHSVHLFNLHKLAAQKQQIVDSLYSKMLRDFLKMDFKTTMINQAGSPLINKNANRAVNQKVSEYGSSTPAEMFADIGAKMITYNLDRKTILPSKNPFVFKDFTEDKHMMQIMNDVWKGNVSQYIQ